MHRVVLLGHLLAAPAAAAPDFVSWQLAGRDVRRTGRVLITDAARGVHFFGTAECDGGHRRVILSRDLSAISINEGFAHSGEMLASFEERHAKALDPITDRGIALGASPEAVRAKLGPPAKDFYSRKFQARELVYRHTDRKADRDYTACYLFRGGRLFYVELSWDSRGGC